MIKKDSPSHVKAYAARLLAVQAFYQVSQNRSAIKTVYQEYLDHRLKAEEDGEEAVQPDAKLFKLVLYGTHERFVELESIVSANLKKDASDRVVEPLLKAILMCAVFEILVQDSIDPPIIINDYLNVGHAFYEKNEVALINGVLDSVVKLLRA
ncbi:MAG: transcription antitermination protein NusB [Alphaproteobacteria bacterium]